MISPLPYGHKPGIPNEPRLTVVPSPFSTSGRRPVSSRTCPTSTTPSARRTRRCSPARPVACTRREATHAPPRAAPRTRRRRRPPPGCWTRSPNMNGPPPRSSPGRRKRRRAARGASSGGCCGPAARWTSATGGSRSPARRARRLRDRSRVSRCHCSRRCPSSPRSRARRLTAVPPCRTSRCGPGRAPPGPPWKRSPRGAYTRR